ncbi:MAG TPA: hypothetical protein VMI75_14415 [Polyangiaceae bacterium]|nr:hypothetical protein [Polyangiaceae bacterium]
MAHPADPAVKAPATFANARLTPEEADRLAAMFRPSWEYDDAPFTGAGSLSPSEIQALQGGGVRAEVRAATAAALAHPVTNGTHAAAPAHEPENSVVIDRSITAADLPSKAGAKTIMGGLQAPVAPPPSTAAPEPALQRPPTPKPIQRPAAPDFRVGPPVARSPASIRQAIQIDEPVAYPRKSRKGLFIGLGAAAAVLVVVGIFAATSGGEKPAPSAATTAAMEKPTEDKLAAVPPPPPAATTADPTPAAPPPPVQTTAPAPPPAPVQPPVAPVTALPVAPSPPPQPHYAAAPPPPRPPPAAAPPHPKKGGQTIVRDVPF